MDKKSQFNLQNIISSQMFERHGSLSKNESETLMNIWDNGISKNGTISPPNNIDPLVIAALVTKGFIRNKYSGIQQAIELTEKAKELIKRMVLSSEISVFEKNKHHKIASKQNITPTKLNWLSRYMD